MTSSFKAARLALSICVGIVGVIASGLYIQTTVNRPAQANSLGQGDYQLVTADGVPFTRASLDGHPSALFFGFTHCPDVCPTTLAEMAVWFEALGDEAKDLKAYFISVDPERDTPEVIGDYVSWNPAVTGVTGSRQEIDKAIKAWAVYAEKVPLTDGGYNVDHTASVFLLNRSGAFEGTISYGENADMAIAKLRRLVSGK